MKKINQTSFFFLCIIVLFSCAGRNNSLFIPIPDSEYFSQKKPIEIGSIIETKDGSLGINMPEWFFVFINAGIGTVEQLASYRDKYVFIGINEGNNFTALNKWADNFSAERDFFLLAAERIERRMIFTSALYPDDEYGVFFETIVKKAYSSEYPGAVKEDIYWVKTENYNSNEELLFSPELYRFFILVTIDKMTMQAITLNMIRETSSVVSSTASQRNSINRLQQNFFYGF